jgi:hypothetical protein
MSEFCHTFHQNRLNFSFFWKQYFDICHVAHGYDYYGKDPLTYVEEMAENLPVVSNKRMTPFQVNPQVSELLNKFEKNMEALDLLTTEDDDDDRLKGQSDEMCVTAAVTASGGAPKKRPPPLLIPIAAVRQFTEQGLDSLNLAECLVGTPLLPGLAASVSIASTTSENDSPSPVPSDRSSPVPLLSSPEQTVPITPLLFVNPGHELTDEIVEELPPDDGMVVAEEEMVIQITPDHQAPVEKENSKKRKLEPAPKVERVKRKRTTMSVKKEED